MKYNISNFNIAILVVLLLIVAVKSGIIDRSYAFDYEAQKSIENIEENINLEQDSADNNGDNQLSSSKTEKDETIFAKATNEQLEEAERFYDACSKNETMSTMKNCKCAASEYLQKRIELGDDATVKEILSANADKCLINASNPPYDDKEIDLSNVTDAQIKEAEEILQECKSTLKINQLYDCECYAARYLDARIKLGPFASKEIIIGSFSSECRNIVDSTGHEYTRCMAITTKRPVKNIEPKDFCECYARQWGKYFKAHQGRIDLSARNNMKLRAKLYCRRPENYIH